MKTNCKSCKFAIFCYTDPGEWIFRTREDIEKVLHDIEQCPTYKKLLSNKTIKPLPPIENICK